MLLVFTLTLFTSATLLMSVQPMIGNLIKPLLGGTPAVWNTCMVFFEALLLAGYAYAHFATQWLGVRKQALMHLVILLLPFLFFPIAVNEDLIQGGLDNPIPRLLLLLVTSVGVPFFVVSTSAPLLQKWFSTHGAPRRERPVLSLWGQQPRQHDRTAQLSDAHRAGAGAAPRSGMGVGYLLRRC